MTRTQTQRHTYTQDSFPFFQRKNCPGWDSNPRHYNGSKTGEPRSTSFAYRDLHWMSSMATLPQFWVPYPPQETGGRLVYSHPRGLHFELFVFVWFFIAVLFFFPNNFMLGHWLLSALYCTALPIVTFELRYVYSYMYARALDVYAFVA